jgi:hypothetical protein
MMQTSTLGLPARSSPLTLRVLLEDFSAVTMFNN